MVAAAKKQLQAGCYSALVPDFVSEFVCIGPACEDSCCQGWREIGVDADSRELYRLVKDPKLKKRLQEKIAVSEAAKSSHPFKIVLNEDTSCPFWNEEHLCDIQQKLGAEALCTTCATYPRLSKETLGVLEHSLTFSCPEAVRKALLRPAGIRFEHRPLERRTAPLTSAVLQSYLAPEHWNIEAQALERRRDWIAKLQDRSRQLYERIIRCEGAGAEDMSGTPSFLRRAIAQRAFLRRCLASPGLLPCEGSRYEALRRELDAVLDERAGFIARARYLRAARRLSTELLGPHQYIFENFLVAHLFRETLSREAVIRVEDTLLGVLLYYAVLQGHLIALLQVRKRLDVADVVHLVQALAKQCEHRRHSLRDLLVLYRQDAVPGASSVGSIVL